MRKPKFLDKSTPSLEKRGCELNTARDVSVLTKELDAILEQTLSLEIRGCEVNTARYVFVLTRELDAILEHLLEANGYVHHTNIVLSDGQIIDGWVKV